MANTLVNGTLVTFEVAREFANSLRGVGQFNRQYADEYAQKGGKIGDTVKIRLEQQWETSDGEGLVEQNLLDRTVSLVLNRRRHIGFGWSTAEETLDLDDIKNRYVKRAAETLANIYDRLALADVYKSVFNAIGTLGTTPSAALTYSNARTKIADLAGPDSDLVAVLEPYAQAVIADSVKGYHIPVEQVAEAWRKGMFASGQLGIDRFYTDQNIPRFTSGACSAASSPAVNGAGQTGASIVTDGWGAASAPVKGDIVTFAGVRWVNPLSKEDTGRLAQFVLTATPTAGTDITLSISPSIVTSGPLQNVSAAPADNAVVTYWGMSAGGTQAATVSPQNLVFHRDAFATAMVDLALPRGGAEFARVSSKALNISIRWVQQYGIQDDRNRSRLDILFGSVAVKPEFATRVVG
jgi:hypothetical protein